MYKFAQALRRMRKEERGFTLVELMVVVVIIGVLAAVAIPKFAGIIDNSKIKADVATGKTIKDAVDRYYVDNGKYPDTSASPTVTATVTELKSKSYLSAQPKVAQRDGQAALDVPFAIDTNGQVTVYELDSSNARTTTVAWTSGS